MVLGGGARVVASLEASGPSYEAGLERAKLKAGAGG
jgi:hypothetical protein